VLEPTLFQAPLADLEVPKNLSQQKEMRSISERVVEKCLISKRETVSRLSLC